MIDTDESSQLQVANEGQQTGDSSYKNAPIPAVSPSDNQHALHLQMIKDHQKALNLNAIDGYSSSSSGSSPSSHINFNQTPYKNG